MNATIPHERKRGDGEHLLEINADALVARPKTRQTHAAGLETTARASDYGGRGACGFWGGDGGGLSVVETARTFVI